MCRALFKLATMAIFYTLPGSGIKNESFVNTEMKSRWNACTTHCNVLDKALEEFALSLTPPQHLMDFGMQKVKEIENYLRKNRADIDRIVLGGSMGKNTADHLPGVSPPLEFDLFVYLNGVFNPGRPHSWSKTVDEFQKIIEKWERPHLKIVKVTPFYLSVFMDGIKIDISPVANLKEDSFISKLFNKTVQFKQSTANPYENIQLAETIEKISSLANPIQQRRSFMRGFAEAHVTVFNNKIPQFGHSRSLIRLAKFWSKEGVLKCLNPKVFNPVGFSSFIERVALHAATHTYNFSGSTGSKSTSSKKSDSLSTSFSHFLKLLLNFNSLNITHQNFDQDLIIFQSAQSPESGFRFYDQSCHAPGPFVSDLVDPFSNYAMLERDRAKRKQFIKILITAATKSLKHLQKLQEKPNQWQKRLALCENVQFDILNFFVKLPESENFSIC